MADDAVVYQNTEENPYEIPLQQAESSGNIRLATISEAQTSREHGNACSQPETVSAQRSSSNSKNKNLQLFYNVFIAATVLAAFALIAIMFTKIRNLESRLVASEQNRLNDLRALEKRLTASSATRDDQLNETLSSLAVHYNNVTSEFQNQIIELESNNFLFANELSDFKGALQSKSCRDVIPRYREDEGGVYKIFPFSGGKSGIEVYCDLATDNGGWIVFQKRVDGSEDFERNWNDYVNGFGKLDGEFWLGLEILHRLTAAGDYEMRIDFEDFEGAKNYSKFESVQISAGDDYSITLTGYTGDAGNGLANGAKFSTVDKDQDTHAENCAAVYQGGWWFTACHAGNLNGLYLRGEHESYANGVNWRPLRGHHYSLKRAEMKIRKRL